MITISDELRARLLARIEAGEPVTLLLGEGPRPDEVIIGEALQQRLREMIRRDLADLPQPPESPAKAAAAA